jgi:DNA polymerase-4
MEPPGLCRDCLTLVPGAGRCPACGSPRRIVHAELGTLAIAHVDCDAFFASVEKRDDPALRDRPVIIGGGRRGVVSTACYIARIHGVKSAMPMFKALKLCPDAVVLRPRMERYAELAREIRERMLALTPLVEPLSIDEAFLDLSGTERLHGAPPALMMARLQAGIERDLGLTVSVGLSHNKFLAKIASDLDKPRGFAVIGRAETAGFLGPRPVSLIWGVGRATLDALEAEGLRTIADLRGRDRKALIARFGALGDRLWHLSRGEDSRPVASRRTVRSVSSETTFSTDLDQLDALEAALWTLSERVSARLKGGGIAGRTITLKLKRSDHRILTRRTTLAAPVRMADSLYRTAVPMLQREISGSRFRLIGLAVSDLLESTSDSDAGTLFDPDAVRRQGAERATDRIRERFGTDSIRFGRSWR